jgi:hypothetical protein
LVDVWYKRAALRESQTARGRRAGRVVDPATASAASLVHATESYEVSLSSVCNDPHSAVIKWVRWLQRQATQRGGRPLQILLNKHALHKLGKRFVGLVEAQRQAQETDLQQMLAQPPLVALSGSAELRPPECCNGQLILDRVLSFNEWAKQEKKDVPPGDPEALEAVD